VEDNPDMGYFLAQRFSEKYEVLSAVNGVEAIQSARTLQPDLIVSDVMMPEKDGFTLCRELKADPLTAFIPIILLTAKADLQFKLEGFDCGADDYLVKPFDAEELLARARAQIERRRSIKDLETYLNSARRQVQEANLLMLELAHEIKNPISYAKGNISLLTRSTEAVSQNRALEETVRDMKVAIESINAGLNRVSTIVEDVKEFISPSPRRRTFLFLRDVIEDVLSLLDPQTKERIAISRSYQTAGAIEGIPNQMDQLFTNLVKNAIEAMGERGELSIRIAEEGERVIVSIQDSGPGIPTGDLPYLFEPFFTTKKAKGGTGLGLAICKKIVEGHGGKIEVRSEYGRGAEIIVSLIPATVQQS
jgi:signal transduction histidine kinase